MTKIIRDPNILGGSAVFEGSRLPVFHVHKLLEKGEEKRVREDYPYLTDQDLEEAKKPEYANPDPNKEVDWGSPVGNEHW